MIDADEDVDDEAEGPVVADVEETDDSSTSVFDGELEVVVIVDITTEDVDDQAASSESVPDIVDKASLLVVLEDVGTMGTVKEVCELDGLLDELDKEDEELANQIGERASELEVEISESLLVIIGAVGAAGSTDKVCAVDIVVDDEDESNTVPARVDDPSPTENEEVVELAANALPLLVADMIEIAADAKPKSMELVAEDKLIVASVDVAPVTSNSAIVELAEASTGSKIVVVVELVSEPYGAAEDTTADCSVTVVED